MIRTITTRERGATPRNMRKAYTKASKEAWIAAGKFYHTQLRDLRFTAAHGRKVGYKPRRGEEPGLSRRDFFRSYTGIKQRRFGHRRPLEFSGQTRRLVRAVSLSSTSKGVKANYSGARKLNFRNPHSQINMAMEFARIAPDEPRQIGGAYDSTLDRELERDNTQTERRV